MDTDRVGCCPVAKLVEKLNHLGRAVVGRDDQGVLIAGAVIHATQVAGRHEGGHNVVASNEAVHIGIRDHVVTVKVLIVIRGELDHLIHGPLAVVNQLVGVLQLVTGKQVLVEVQLTHHVNNVGGHITGNEVICIAKVHGVNKLLRPPGHGQIHVVVLLDSGHVVQVAVHCCKAKGTGVCDRDIVHLGRGVVLVLHVLNERGDIAAVTGLAVPYKLYVEAVLDLVVTVMDSVTHVITGNRLLLELGVLGVGPVQDADLFALKVEVAGQVILQTAVDVICVIDQTGITLVASGAIGGVVTCNDQDEQGHASKQQSKQSGKNLHASLHSFFGLKYRPVGYTPPTGLVDTYILPKTPSNVNIKLY